MTETVEQLLVEQWGTSDNPISILEQNNPGNFEPLTEASIHNSKSGALYIQGVFLQADVVNGNKRLYPKRILEIAVDRYIKEQIIPRQSLGELNHPARPMVDPLHSCLIIEKLWWEGNNVMGRARVVTGDYAEGDKVAALIRAGWVPGVSSRGLGRVVQKNGYNEVQEGFRLTVGVDIVWGPSAPNAFVKPVYENKIIDTNDTNDTNNNNTNDSSELNEENKITSVNESKIIIEALNKYNKRRKDEKTITSLVENLKSFQVLNK